MTLNMIPYNESLAKQAEVAVETLVVALEAIDAEEPGRTTKEWLCLTRLTALLIRNRPLLKDTREHD